MSKKTQILFAAAVFVASIFLAGRANACVLSANKAYRVKNNNGVYYISAKCTKKIFQDSKVFFTYFSSWSAAKFTTAKTLSKVPFDKDRYMTAKVVKKPVPPADPTMLQKLTAISSLKVWFGHQSVGAQVLDGVRRILKANPGSGVSVVQTASAKNIGAGVIGNDFVGENEDAVSKLNAFAGDIRGGIGSTVNLAFMKFCYVDFPTNLDFNTYKTTMANLQAQYPKVKFLHVTVPLGEAGDAASKNDKREGWNTKLRSTYPAEQIFDLAYYESHDKFNNLCVSKTDDGLNHPCLANDWAANDGGHLNEAGQDMLAKKFIDFLYRNR